MSMKTPGTQPTGAGSIAEQPEGLARAITAPLLFFYVLGDVLGLGIYALVGVMASQVGGAFWTSFVVGLPRHLVHRLDGGAHERARRWRS